VILTTRSGTNTFHGKVFDYFRNDAMDANDWFANHAGQPRAAERHNDFGGSVGGPIVKDKTFFFSYEGARLRLPQTQIIEVPSADVVAGISGTVISAASEHAFSDFDVRHSFSGAVTYDIPAAAKSGPWPS
jgi:hypothetical protein